MANKDDYQLDSADMIQIGTTVHGSYISPDKARLWDDLKWDLEGRANRCEGNQLTGYRSTPDAQLARADLDRMLQMEILATYVRPATPATFARVAADMRGDEFPEPGMELLP